MCILFAYTLLKVVSYYDTSVLSMSVMGFQKKFVWRVGGVSSIGFYFLKFFNFAKPLNTIELKSEYMYIDERHTTGERGE